MPVKNQNEVNRLENYAQCQQCNQVLMQSSYFSELDATVFSGCALKIRGLMHSF